MWRKHSPKSGALLEHNSLFARVSNVLLERLVIQKDCQETGACEHGEKRREGFPPPPMEGKQQ